MNEFIPAEYIELFHLHFLEQLGLKTDKKLYALKGGCNLRFFLRSIRYSQDIDIDVKIIGKETLANRVRKIIHSTTLTRFLQVHDIEIMNFTEPKQTETTQRWKISLKVPRSATLLNTKIEFSRREMKGDIKFEAIDTMISSKYQLNPIFASHYTAEIAFQQKLRALVGRNETQARDVFDLFHLIGLGIQKPQLTSQEVKKIEEHALSLTYEEFKSQVVAYLPPEYHSQYDDSSVWDQLVLRVLETVSNETH